MLHAQARFHRCYAHRFHRRYAHRYLPLLGELEGVGEQVLEHLLQALCVGVERFRQARCEFYAKADAAALCYVAEGPFGLFADGGERYVIKVQRLGAGFDLGQVEDVADESQLVLARSLDGLGVFDLLPAQVALGVFGEQLRQDQQAVERRAQLVRHAGEEL